MTPRRAAPTVAAAVAVAALAAGCGLPDGDYFGRVPDVRDRPRHLRLCNSGEPEGLDPATVSSTTAMKAVYELFDGLTTYDLAGLPEASLATRWDTSADVRRFTFHMHDRGRWSNGRPITADDVRYQVIRVLHPSTASVNADGLAPLKNAALYNAGAARLVLRDTGALRAGDVVEVLAVDGKTLDAWHAAGDRVPDSNLRRGSRPLALRDRGAAVADAYGQVPPGDDVQIVELSGDPLRPDADTWAYVYWNHGDGLYGWVPLADLDVAPFDDAVYRVRRRAPRDTPGVDLSPAELTAPDPPRPAVEARGADLMALPEVLGVRVPDPYTVVFETSNPTPWFLNLSDNRILRPTPREAVSRRPRRWTDPDTIVTSGPMHLTAWYQRDRIELTRSPTYWDPDEVKLDRITLYAIDDQSAATNFYFAGGCDAVSSNQVPASYIRALEGRYKDFSIEPYLGIYMALIQTEQFPNRHLRRALSFAVDRRPLPTFLQGGQVPTAQFMPGTPIARLSDDDLRLCGVTRDTPGVASIMISGELCYVPPPGLDFDPERARAELQLARDEMGADFPTHLVYRFNQGVEGHKLIGEYLQHQWKEILGLDVDLEVQEWKTFLTDTKNGNYQVARFAWVGNFPDAEGEFLPMFRCGSPNNRARWCNPAFEAAMDAAQTIQDRKARLVQVREAERIMIEDAPVIPLYVYVQTNLRKPYVRDLGLNLIDQQPLHRAWLDPDWRAHRDGAAP
ncbi:MAG: peptide ABC transporter substrate-binding protein [Kofleriaceae bacterium]|nr:peptide ABC transporter substrate-binding protein [Myxococcales bacterium]MCB9561469.1 peptide ABC transporter substrate-binding protein [Kofleriaceae bacterium]MCB9573523.1 peptide ABC transporter substrate-binding protein [Kofleriaceae bacterium]